MVFMDKEQIIEAVRNATKGTFVPCEAITTCLGWEQEYDELGRPLRGDPNTITGRIKIDGKYYKIKTCEWISRIYDWDTGELIGEVDFTPQYIKEYREKKNKEK